MHTVTFSSVHSYNEVLSRLKNKLIEKYEKKCTYNEKEKKWTISIDSKAQVIKIDKELLGSNGQPNEITLLYTMESSTIAEIIESIKGSIINSEDSPLETCRPLLEFSEIYVTPRLNTVQVLYGTNEYFIPLERLERSPFFKALFSGNFRTQSGLNKYEVDENRRTVRLNILSKNDAFCTSSDLLDPFLHAMEVVNQADFERWSLASLALAYAGADRCAETFMKDSLLNAISSRAISSGEEHAISCTFFSCLLEIAEQNQFHPLEAVLATVYNKNIEYYITTPSASLDEEHIKYGIQKNDKLCLIGKMQSSKEINTTRLKSFIKKSLNLTELLIENYKFNLKIIDSLYNEELFFEELFEIESYVEKLATDELTEEEATQLAFNIENPVEEESTKGKNINGKRLASSQFENPVQKSTKTSENEHLIRKLQKVTINDLSITKEALPSFEKLFKSIMQEGFSNSFSKDESDEIWKSIITYDLFRKFYLNSSCKNFDDEILQKNRFFDINFLRYANLQEGFSDEPFKELLNDKSTILNFIKKEPLLFGRLSDALKNDLDIARIAISQIPSMIRHAGEKIKNEIEMAYIVGFRDPKSLRFFNEDIQNKVRLILDQPPS